MSRYIIYCKNYKEDFYKSILLRLSGGNLEALIIYMEKCYQCYPRNSYKIVDYETGKTVYN